MSTETLRLKQTKAKHHFSMPLGSLWHKTKSNNDPSLALRGPQDSTTSRFVCTVIKSTSDATFIKLINHPNLYNYCLRVVLMSRGNVFGSKGIPPPWRQDPKVYHRGPYPEPTGSSPPVNLTKI
jgi:hypothetical protein